MVARDVEMVAGKGCVVEDLSWEEFRIQVPIRESKPYELLQMTTSMLVLLTVNGTTDSAKRTERLASQGQLTHNFVCDICVRRTSHPTGQYFPPTDSHFQDKGRL